MLRGYMMNATDNVKKVERASFINFSGQSSGIKG